MLKRNITLIMLVVLVFTLSSVVFSLPTPQTLDNSHWEQTKYDGIQQEYFNIEETNLGNGKLKVCLILKVDTTSKDSWYKDNEAELKKQAGSLSNTKIQPDDWEKETEKGNIKKMCIDIDSSTEQYVKIGSHSLVYEWINSTLYIYETDKLDLEPFEIEILCNDIKLETPDISFVSKEPITEGVKFSAQLENFTCDGKITFRQNKLYENELLWATQFGQETKSYFIDYSDFESSESNNITDMNITTELPEGWDGWYYCVAKNPLNPTKWYDCMNEPRYYDTNYYGTFLDLDPSLQEVVTTSSKIFTNQTEISNLGARLDTPVLNMQFNSAPEENYVQDDSIYNNFGVNNGATYNSSCGSSGVHDLGGCYEFDGNDHINLTYNVLFDPVDKGDITISSWIKTSSATNQPIFVNIRPDSTRGYYLRVRDTGVLAFYANGVTNDELLVGTKDVADGEWHHVIANWKGTDDDVLFYVDGEYIETISSPTVIGSLSSITIDPQIGILSSVPMYFNGSIDNFQFWDRSLSVDEISNLYNGTINNSNYIGKYASNGDFKSLVFYNDTNTYWNTTFSLADSDGSAEVYDLCQADDNCVSYWDFNNRYTDQKGSNDGTPTGTNNATGISSGAMRFDGVDDFIETGVGLETSQVWWLNNTFYANVSGTYYKNGILNTSTMNFVLNGSGIGKTGASFVGGTIDEVLIYNDTLTASEVESLYKAGLSQHADTNITLQTRTATSYNLSDSNLAVFYPFNDSVFDITVGEGGSFPNGATYGEGYGVVGAGVNTNGVNQYINLNTGLKNRVGSEGAVSMWFNLDSLAVRNMIVGITDLSQTDNHFKIYVDPDGLLDWQLRDDASNYDGLVYNCLDENGNIFTTGKWYNLVLMSNHEVYINGENVTSTCSDGSVDPSGWFDNLNLAIVDSWSIGRDASNNDAVRFVSNASFDEFKVYNRTLSTDEIQNLYELGSYHIEWSDWEDEGRVNDSIETQMSNSGSFMQFKPIFNTNDTDVSPYLLNYSILATIQDTKPDTTPPTITDFVSLITIYDNTSIVNYEIINATDETSMHLTKPYVINGSIFNISLNGEITNITSLINGTYKFNITAQDSSGNNDSDTLTLKVLQTAVLDLDSPTWSNNLTNLTSQTLINESFNLSITFSDLNPDKYILSYWNGTIWINNSPSSYVSGSPNVDNLTLSIIDGYFNWTYYANDTSGNTNQTDVWSIEIIPIPVITNIYPVNGVTYTELPTVANFTVTYGTGGGSMCWYETMWEGIETGYIEATTTGEYEFSVPFPENFGVNGIIIYCNGTNGEIGSDNSMFGLNLPPYIEMVTPLNNSDQDLVFDLTIISNDTMDLDSTWYYWRGTNYTYSGTIDLTASAGDYEIYAWANDTYGSVSSTYVNFSTIDHDTIIPDTNASTECLDSEVLLGNGTCYPISNLQINATCPTNYSITGIYANNTIICTYLNYSTSESGGDAITIETCRYKNFGYYNLKLPWLRQEACV